MFYSVRFLEDIKSHREEGECGKRSSTLCKTPKVSSTPTNYAASIQVTDILRAGKLVKKEPPTIVKLAEFDMSSIQWVTEKKRKFHVEKDNFQVERLKMCSMQQTQLMEVNGLLVMGDGKFGEWFIYVRVWVRGQGGGYHTFSIFCSVFVLLLIAFSWLVHDTLFCLFHCFFFTFFVSGPFNQTLLVYGNCCVCFVKLFQKSGF